MLIPTRFYICLAQDLLHRSCPNVQACSFASHPWTAGKRLISVSTIARNTVVASAFKHLHSHSHSRLAVPHSVSEAGYWFFSRAYKVDVIRFEQGSGYVSENSMTREVDISRSATVQSFVRDLEMAQRPTYKRGRSRVQRIFLRSHVEWKLIIRLGSRLLDTIPN